jgi:hypothetical protein
MNYELSQHAKDTLAERQISDEWLERVFAMPEIIEPDKTDSKLTHHLGHIAEHGNRVLRVVINKQAQPVRIVTVYFDRTMKDKL